MVYHKKKVLTILVCLVMVLQFPVLSSAKATDSVTQPESVVKPFYTYITYTHTNLSSSGSVYAEVIGTSSVNKVEITTSLQQKGTSGWSTKDSWTETFYSSYGILSRSATLASGKTYRLYSVYTVYTDDSSETHSEYSNEVSK